MRGVRAWLSRLRPLELRWRLAASVAAVLIVSSAITFVSVYNSTGGQLRHQIDNEIAGDAEELGRTLQGAEPSSTSDLREAAEDYIRAQPFSTTSTLLFVNIEGQGVVTNGPELFTAKPPDRGESGLLERSEEALDRRLLQARDGYTTMRLPDLGELRLQRRIVRLPAQGSMPAQSVTIGVGESLAPVARAQDAVSRAFLVAGLIAIAGALLAALLIGTRLSDPLRRMATVAKQVDGGDLDPRIRDPDRGTREIRVLADAFNHMLDRLADAFEVQRAFVADASHELRTPLTVIRGQLEVLATQPNPAAEEVRRVEQLVQAEVSRITRLVDDLLLLARSEHTEFLRIEGVAVEPFVTELWDGFTLLDEQRTFELGAIAAGTLQADPDRLAQALRNLIANAIEHTAPGSGRVLLHVERAAPGWVRFAVEDDGPGIPADKRELVFGRFHRTDEGRARAAGGTGLGLAIVKAIAEAHRGRVTAATSRLGGARIELELPGFLPAPRPLGDPPAAPATGRAG